MQQYLRGHKPIKIYNSDDTLLRYYPYNKKPYLGSIFEETNNSIESPISCKNLDNDTVISLDNNNANYTFDTTTMYKITLKFMTDDTTVKKIKSIYTHAYSTSYKYNSTTYYNAIIIEINYDNFSVVLIKCNSKKLVLQINTGGYVIIDSIIPCSISSQKRIKKASYLISNKKLFWCKSNSLPENVATIKYINELFITSCTNKGLYYSEDGINWTQSNITTGTYEVLYNNNIWVAVGSSYPLYSTDGKYWITGTTKINASSEFDYIYDRWITTSHYSLDGKTWIKNASNGHNNSSNLECVSKYANGLWVTSFYANGIWYSTDGINWTQSNIEYNGWTISFEKNIWIAVHNSSYMGTPDSVINSGILYSYDGKYWYLSNIDIFYGNGGGYTVKNLNNILFVNNYYSLNGKTWTKVNYTDNGKTVYVDSRYMKYINDMYITYDGYSYNGINWYKYTRPGLITSYAVRPLVYINNILIFSHWYSHDGITWHISNNASYNVIAGNEKIILMGNSNGLYYASIQGFIEKQED